MTRNDPPQTRADDFVINDVDGKRTLVEYRGTSLTPVIPDGVEVIAERVFFQKGLTAVTVPDSVTTIGAHAFQGNALSEVSGANVAAVGAYAFADNALTSVSFMLGEVGEYAFANNHLTSWSQASGNIGVSAFVSNDISELDLTGFTGGIGDNAFVRNRLARVEIPAEATLGSNVFGGNGRWVIITTDNSAITSQESPDGYGQIVNPAVITLFLVDKANGNPIAPKRVVGADPTQEMYPVGETVQITPPNISGWRPVTSPVSVEVTDATMDVTIEYESRTDDPIISLKNPSAGNRLQVAPGATVDEAWLLSQVSAVDLEETDISDRITVTPNSIDTSTSHEEEVVYSVTDSFGNTGTLTVSIFVGVDWPSFELGNGWTLGDFAYMGNSVLGFTPEGYQKIAAHPSVIMPHINPYTLEEITDIAGKRDTYGPTNKYQCENLNKCNNDGLWQVNATTWNGSGADPLFRGSVPDGAHLDGIPSDPNGDPSGAGPLATVDNAVAFQAVDPNVEFRVSFRPDAKIETISSEAFSGIANYIQRLDGTRQKGSWGYEVSIPGHTHEYTRDSGQLALRSFDFTNIKNTLREIGSYAFFGWANAQGQDIIIDNFPNLTKIGRSSFANSFARELSISNNPNLQVVDFMSFYTRYNDGRSDVLRLVNNPKLAVVGESAFTGRSGAEEMTFSGLTGLTTIIPGGRGDNTLGVYPGQETFVCGGCVNLRSVDPQLFSPPNRHTSNWKLVDFTAAANLDTSFLGAGTFARAAGDPAYGDRVVVKLTDELAASTPSRYNYVINPPDPATIPGTGEDPNWNPDDFVYQTRDDGATAIVGFSASGALKFANGHTAITLPATSPEGRPVEELGTGAFTGFNLTELDASGVPTLRTLGDNFGSLRAIRTLNFANTKITNLPVGYTNGAAFLLKVDLTNTPIKAFNANQFRETSSLKTLITTGMDELRTINSSAFRGSYLQELKLADFPNLEVIGNEAFIGSKLFLSNAEYGRAGTVIDLSSNPALTTIGDRAFRDLYSGKSYKLDLSNNPALTTIGQEAFAVYSPRVPSRLTSLDLGGTALESIGAGAFANHNLTEVRLPSSLRELALTEDSPAGRSPFYGNPGVNKYQQVIIRTPDGSNPAGIATDYLSGVSSYYDVNDGWMINPVRVTIEARTQDDGTLLRTYTEWVSADRQYNLPQVGEWIPVTPIITLEKRAADYTLVAPYTSIADLDNLNDDLRLRQDNWNGLVDYEIGDEMATWVYFDATGIDMDETGLAIELSYDPAFVNERAIKVAPSDFIKNSEVRAENGRLVIPLADHITGGTSLQIPVTWKFLPNQTPQGQELAIHGVVLDKDRKVLQIADPITLRGHYQLPAFNKYAGNSQDDGRVLVDPKVAISYDAITEGEIHYSFKVSDLQRYIGDWTITDVLPMYAKVEISGGEPVYDNGQLVTSQARAVFDPDRNPGWTLSADGTEVSYTSKGTRTLAIDIPRLVLTYPFAATHDNIKNTAKITLTPHNRPDFEPIIELESSRVNLFDTSIREVPWGGVEDYLMQAISPHYHRDYGAYIYDVAGERTEEVNWALIANSRKRGFDTNMTNMSYEFLDLDERLYPEGVTLPWAGEITAYGPDGNPIGTITTDEGKRIDFPDTWHDAVRFEINADPSVVISNAQTRVIMHTKLRDPDAELFDPTPGSQANVFKANSNFAADFDTISAPEWAETGKHHTEKTDPSTVTIVRPTQTVRLHKSTTYPSNTSVFANRAGSYMLSVKRQGGNSELAKFAFEPLEDAVLIDVLPQWLTLTGVSLSSEFAAAGGTYRTADIGDGRLMVIFEAEKLPASVEDIATIETTTNIEVKDGQVLNTAYLGWSNDHVMADNPSLITTPVDQLGNDLALEEIGVVGPQRTFIFDRVAFNLLKVKELSARKTIRLNENDPWTPTGVRTELGGEFAYRLALVNNMDASHADASRTGMEIYDVLPTPGDKGITTGQERESAFANTLIGAQVPAGYTMSYTQDVIDQSQFNNQEGPDNYLPTLTWQVWDGASALPEGITAVHIKADDGVTLESGETLEVILNMRAPEDPKMVGKRAWNSFVRADDSATRLIEPNRVYNEIRYPDAEISLRKVAAGEGDNPLAGVRFGLFELRGDMSYFVSSVLTNDNGEATFTGVDPTHDYEVRELTRPIGPGGTPYNPIDPIPVTSKQLLADGTYRIDLGEIENTLPWQEITPLFGAVSVLKVNPNGDPISGIPFKLRSVKDYTELIEQGFTPGEGSGMTLDVDNHLVMTSYTGMTGYAHFNQVPLGKYTVTELPSTTHFHGEFTTEITLSNTGNPEVAPHVYIHGENAVVNDRAQVSLVKLGILNEENAAKDWRELNSGDGVRLAGATISLVKVETGEVAATEVTDDRGEIHFVGLELDTLYRVREDVTPEDYQSLGADITFRITMDGTLVDADGKPLTYPSIYVPNERKEYVSSATIHKVDNNGTDLAGAIFQLERANAAGEYAPWTNDEISAGSAAANLPEGQLISGDDGVVLFTGLTPGSYRISEVSAPSGYKASFTPVTFVVDSRTAKDFPFEAVNPAYGLQVTKVEALLTLVDEATADEYVAAHPGTVKIANGSRFNVERLLPGATFALYEMEEVNGELVRATDPVETVVTGDNGIGVITSRLDGATTYELVEISAPAGYRPDSQPYQFRPSDFDSDADFDGIIRMRAHNAPNLGEISVLKYSGLNGEKLEGARFALYQGDADDLTSEGTLIGEATTDARGIAAFAGLTLDLPYYLVELAAPAGHTPVKGRIDAGVLTEERRVVTLAVYNDGVGFEFIKTDQIGDALPGAEFALYRSADDPTEIARATADASGRVTFTDLGPGTYWLTEITAPDGYLLPETGWEVIVSDDGSVTITGADVTIGNAAAIAAGTGTGLSAGTLAGDSADSTTHGLANGFTTGMAVRDEVGDDSATPHIVNHPVPPVEASFSGTKQLTGLDLEADAFTFVLSEAGEEIATATNDADGTFTFTQSYREPGVHEYVVSEKAGTRAGMEYSSATFGVRVTVTADARVALSAEVEMLDGDITFVNTYEPPTVDVRIDGEKSLTGRAMTAGEFSFGLFDADGTQVGVATNDADGAFGFDLTFDKPGTYEYQVKEIAGDDPDVTYSGAVFTAVVTVVADENGALSGEVAINDGPLAFVNEYHPEPISVSFAGDKTLVGRDLAEGEFSFGLYAADGKQVATTVNDANGAFGFDLTFDKPGTYEYQVKEIAGDDPHITYSDAVFGVVITVVADPVTGKLSAQTSLSDGEISFVNEYHPDAVSVRFAGDKTLVGRELVDGEFTFALLAADGTEVATAVNDINGAFGFALTFDKPGTYEYQVKEIAGDDPHITYSDAVFGVVITVAADPVTGELSAETSLSDGEISFVNEFEPDAIPVRLTGDKTLVGRELTEGEFSFGLFAADGTQVATTVNDANGAFGFDLTFDKPGTYEYQVKEIAGDDPRITYSDVVHEVVITVVADPVSGALSARTEMNNGAITFENTFTPPETPPENPPEVPSTGANVIGVSILAGGMLLAGTAMIGRRRYRIR